MIFTSKLGNLIDIIEYIANTPVVSKDVNSEQIRAADLNAIFQVFSQLRV